jgi:hypothetical protein
MGFLSDDGGETYNRCHCKPLPLYLSGIHSLLTSRYVVWSNFEIGALDLWRGEAYSKFFDFLDEQGGFYYERWGDAPVHSIGAALFANKDQIHFFNDIGYRHEPFQVCFRVNFLDLGDWVLGGLRGGYGHGSWTCDVWLTCITSCSALPPAAPTQERQMLVRPGRELRWVDSSPSLVNLDLYSCTLLSPSFPDGEW